MTSGGNLGCDTMITSEWGTPNMVENGVNAELLLAGKYGHRLHVWDLRRRRHRQVLDLGSEQQMVLELRPAHDPAKAYGFAGVVTSLKDLSASVWLWHRDGGNGDFQIRKVIEIPATPADPDLLPPLLKGFGAVPPLVTDLNVSLDDRFLYVSCWGTGELRQYDVSDPFSPTLMSTVKAGGIVNRTPHPASPGRPLNGAPQMVEIATAGASTSRIRCMRPGMNSSIQMAFAAGWPRRTSAAMAASLWTTDSSSSSMACVRIRFISKVATRRPTRTAIREVGDV